MYLGIELSRPEAKPISPAKQTEEGTSILVALGTHGWVDAPGFPLKGSQAWLLLAPPKRDVLVKQRDTSQAQAAASELCFFAASRCRRSVVPASTRTKPFAFSSTGAGEANATVGLASRRTMP